MNAPIDISQVVIETPRLLLRPWQLNDLDDFYEYAKVEGVGELAGWIHHESKEKSLEILTSFIEGKKTFAIINKENEKAIGSLGIEPYNESQVDDTFQSLQCREIGYVLSKDYWGQGLMPEAVQAVIHYCFETLQLDALFCGHFIRNHQSQRVIEKCGFTFYKEILFETRYHTIEKTRLYVLKKESTR
ncbi:MAG: GNAT family N-acetyltransferase [Erysipelotrichaceae bacterium]|nr:GNAT family N-acetyltransferase [Erysipelotrichaceae bacterium]